MKIKILNGKKVKIRKLSRNDLKNVKKFQDHINSLISEEAKILMKKKKSLKEEREWLKGKIKDVGNHKEVFLVAECDNKIVGTTGIGLHKEREEHVGEFGIVIRQGYRGIGLGKYLMGEILKMAKRELKPRPKVIRLSVYPNNKPAINLYKKMGFKIVAKIPKQIQYKGKLLGETVMIKIIDK